MRCPFCAHEDSQVKDSRPAEDGSAIRRRRQCDGCGARFTTFERVQLRGRARGLGSGHLFKLTGYDRADQNREYLVVGARYRIHQEPYETGFGDSSEQFTSELDCMDASQAFRPQPVTPRPIVQGPQTALVVGPNPWRWRWCTFWAWH